MFEFLASLHWSIWGLIIIGFTGLVFIITRKRVAKGMLIGEVILEVLCVALEILAEIVGSVL